MIPFRNSKPTQTQTMKRTILHKKAAVFLVLTFLISWTLAFAFFANGGHTYSPSWFVAAILFMFTPMVAAIAVQKLIYREAVLGPLGVSFRPNRWMVIGWLFPALLAVAATGVSLLFPGIHFTRDPVSANAFQFFGAALTDAQIGQLRQKLVELPLHPFFLSILGGSIAGLTINAVAGFGEELGWRGLLQREWAGLGFWKSSWCIGFVWGIWHTPFILHGYNYPGHPIAGVVAMTLWTMLFSPLIAYVRIRSGSVIGAAIMHGALNGTAIAPALVLRGGDSLTVGVIGIAGCLVLLFCNGLLFWFANKVGWQAPPPSFSSGHRF